MHAPSPAATPVGGSNPFASASPDEHSRGWWHAGLTSRAIPAHCFFGVISERWTSSFIRALTMLRRNKRWINIAISMTVLVVRRIFCLAFLENTRINNIRPVRQANQTDRRSGVVYMSWRSDNRARLFRLPSSCRRSIWEISFTRKQHIAAAEAVCTRSQPTPTS